MRGNVDRQHTMFVMINVETRIPKDHPLRAVKLRCDNILEHMRKDFNKAYSHTGRSGVSPEQLLKALLLQALYSIRSEIQLMQAIEFNLLYRWFLDIRGDTNVWTPEEDQGQRHHVNLQRCGLRRMADALERTFFELLVPDAEARPIPKENLALDGIILAHFYRLWYKEFGFGQQAL